MKRAMKAAQVNKNAELESLVNAHAQKIAELKAAYANLKLEKENLMADYQRLLEKHKMFVEKTELEKAELVEAHATELAGSMRSWIRRPRTTPTIA
jgi:predicted nuclease with TOPRIM domain